MMDKLCCTYVILLVMCLGADSIKHIEHDGCLAAEYPFYTKAEASVFVRSIRRRRQVDCSGQIGINVDCTGNELSCECNKIACQNENSREVVCVARYSPCPVGDRWTLTVPCPAHYQCTCVTDYCKSSPCANGGKCINWTDRYYCNCLTDFIGSNCETDMCSPYHNSPPDIVFLLDTSMSQGIHSLNRSKHYIKKFISSVDIGPSHVQVALVTYSYDVNVVFSLNESYAESFLEQAVDGVELGNGPSLTGKAFREVENYVLTESLGLRPFSQPYVILLSDGLSSYIMDTAEQAAVLRRKGVQILSVGVGDEVCHEELQTIASNDAYVYSTVNDDALNLLKRYHTMDGCSKCGEKYADLAFLMDASNDVTMQTYVRQLQALTAFMRTLNIHQDNVRTSYTIYADVIKEMYKFSDFLSMDNQNIAINSQMQIQAGGNISHALRHFLDNGFQTNTGARLQSRKVLMIFTNGNFDDADMAALEADRLKATGVYIVTVASDSNVNMTSLVSIATDPGYVYAWGEYIQTPYSVVNVLRSLIEFYHCDD